MSTSRREFIRNLGVTAVALALAPELSSLAQAKEVIPKPTMMSPDLSEIEDAYRTLYRQRLSLCKPPYFDWYECKMPDQASIDWANEVFARLRKYEYETYSYWKLNEMSDLEKEHWRAQRDIYIRVGEEECEREERYKREYMISRAKTELRLAPE